MGYKDFIQLDSPATKDEVLCTFRIEHDPSVEFAWAGGALAAESSIGTWDPGLTTMTDEARKHGARVVKLDEAKKLVWVAYPESLFERGNLAQLLSSVVGNVYGLKEVRKLRFVDIEMPAGFVKSFPGPQVGFEGVRKMTGIRDRPILGTIVKPKLGLSSESWSDAAYKAWRGGVDFVKDDENLTHMVFNGFYKRAELVLAAKKKAERETGEKKLYFSNISAPVKEMKKRADFVIGLGNEYVMIDILTVGWSAVQEMRDHLEGKNVAIHAHRAMHGAFSRLEEHGIDMLPVSKWARMVGVDNLHAGTLGAGKMFTEGGKSHARQIYDFLRSDWHGLKRTIPVASGGLHPGVVPMVWEANGGSPDFAATAGGGIHGNPLGSEAGARALRQAVEAYQKRIGLEEYAKSHPELAAALKRWGTKPPGGDDS